MASPARSLRTELLVSFGFVTSAAVILVGLTTLLLTGGSLRETIRPLGALWLGCTTIFIIFGMSVLHRLVIRPLHRLTAEADALAAREVRTEQVDYGSVELDRLAARYRAMAEDLLDVQGHVVQVEKLAGIGRLAAGVAHEVRNPLGALGTYVEVLQRRGTDPAVTGDMRCAIERIERIVQGLVDYARPVPGQREPNGSGIPSTDLNASVQRVMDFLRAQGTFSGHAVDIALAEGLPLVRGVEHRLEQVVVNLVVNACQAAPRGRIAVGTAARGCETRTSPRLPAGSPGVLLYVTDEGPGVPEADRDRVFDPFYTTKDPGEGTGLGLAIVARTVHESGGVVWVDPSGEGGAVFMVFLPIASEIDAAVDR